ncbi:MAG: 3-dehydroquinate synthase [Phycisphaerales bacterium]|nr:3-dehydroquinate synthase [Phycisphaerales bacterium]
MDNQSPQRVRVNLAERGYDILIGSGALAQITEQLVSMHQSGARRAFVVVDTGVPQRFVDHLLSSIDSAGLEPTTASITPSEPIKSIGTYQALLEQIASTGHSRVDPVIALGGGIVGDLAGFVAASYRRGVPVIQCPTTLLSMVDASVGGKTGFNLSISLSDGSSKLLKNLIGAFWQPRLVIADIDVLDSLEPRHRRSGLAECIKHGCISSGVGHDGLLDWMIDHLDQITRFEPQIITELVKRNVELKASVVALDEREDTSKQGGRMLLNFGHTFGHAIETIPHLTPDPSDPTLSPLHHGEAIALGMVAACRAAQSEHDLDPSVGDELVQVLERIGLPTQIADLISDSELIERMLHDKKSTAGTLRVIYPIERGVCKVIDNASSDSVRSGFSSIRRAF